MNSKTKNIIGWILAVVLALAFVMAGGVKLSGQAEMIQNFEKWGLPIRAMYLIGGAEILGAIGILIPKTRFLAVLGLLGLMLGAIGTHLLNGEAFIPPLVLLILLGALTWIRKPLNSN
ncbi:DoxX-like family protein [Marivirga sericea]|uniref:DoxX-like family protein n=1 Tax=Marivirga sericea TaxID=1028 RepID=A0A1X7L2P8_9BACT|nr:DoxX family protein [Marivirga sericea]SMG48010.1 DoxX-like family protein [Marivirga sericea]